jgi:hypothetical protein
MSKKTIHFKCEESIKEKAQRDAKRIMGSNNLTNYLVYLINQQNEEKINTEA